MGVEWALKAGWVIKVVMERGRGRRLCCGKICWGRIHWGKVCRGKLCWHVKW